MSDPNPAGESLARSSGIMAVGTVLSRVTGFARDLAVATAIGRAALSDAFQVSLTIPTILYVLLAGGVLNAVFVPQVVRAMKEHEDGGKGYVDRLLTLSGIALAVITIVATAAAPLIVRPYVDWSGEDYRIVVLFTYWALPQIFFYGITTMLGQVLNARGRFGPMMWAPILNNIIMISCAALFLVLIEGIDFNEPTSIPLWGIALLGGGSTLGAVSQTLALLPSLRSSGYRFTPRRDFRGFGLRKAAGLAKWTMLFVAANQVGLWVITRVGTSVTEQAKALVPHGVGFSAYQSAHLVFVLPHAIATVSVVTALLPRMSAAAVEGRMKDVGDDIATGLRLCAVVVVPASVAFLAFGMYIGTVLYGSATVATGRYIGFIIMAFGPGLLAFTGHYLALRGFYAREDTRTPFFISLVINAVNIALVLLAYRVLPVVWVTVGMAAAYAVANYVGMVVSFSILRRRTGGIDRGRVLRTYGNLLLAAVAAALPAYTAAAAVTSQLGSSISGSAVALATAGTIMSVLYFLFARQMRVPEVTTLLGLVRGRLVR